MPSPRSRPGQALLEMIIALGVLTSITVSLVRLSAVSYDGGETGREYTAAAFYAGGGLDAVRSIAASDFASLADGTYGLDESTGRYLFAGTSDTLGVYTRTITVATATRTGGGQLLDDASGYADPLTKKVTATVTWRAAGRTWTRTVALSTFLTSWR